MSESQAGTPSLPLVSIIVPVYNVAPYLRECLDSIKSQTFTNWEALCVDDGSTDESASILDAYAAADSRFLVTHQVNQGVSVARNNALQAARAPYIMMIDADDWVDSDMVERMVEAMEEIGAELGVCRWITHEDDSRKQQQVKSPQIEHGIKIKEGWNLLELDSQVRIKFSSIVWNKIFRTSVIREAKLLFPLGVKFGEDSTFTIKYLSCCHHIICLSQASYHHRSCVGVTKAIDNRTVSQKDVQGIMKGIQEIMECKAATHLTNKQKRGFYTLILSSVLTSRQSCAKLMTKETLKQNRFPYCFVFRTFFRSNMGLAAKTILKYCISSLKK